MQQYELNLKDYLRIFRKRRFTIILIFVVVSAASFFYVSQQPVLYEVEATVKIEERKNVAGLLTEMLVYNPADIMESETKDIKSYPIMKKVALRLKKINANSSLDEVNEAVNDIQGSVDTERVKDTNMIRILSTSLVAKEAVDLVNAVAEVYIEESLSEKAKQSRHTRIFIEEQLASLESRLRQAEERFNQLGSNARQIKLAEPIQRKLIDLETELSGLLQKYTEKHPSVVQLKEQIRSVEVQIPEFSGEDLEYSRLEREVEVNKKLYSMLKEKLEEARISEAEKISDVSIVNPAVMPSSPISGNKEAGVLVGMLMGLILGFVLAFVLETLDTSIGTIEDVENIIKLPVLGLVPSIEGEIKNKRGILERLKAMIFPGPKSQEEERFIRLISHYKPDSSVAESYRNIQTNIKLSQERKVILVTSSGPREGKTSIAINLSIVMAQSGLKTLLISADLRRPVLASVFGVRKEPGLNELMMGTATLDKVLQNITDIMLGDMKFEEIRATPGMENIWIIASGKLLSHTVEFLGSKEMTNLIALLKTKFDVIIFDTPPVLPVTDTSLLAPKVDCAVIVYEIGRTSREALLRTKIQLESVGAKVVGVILNNTRTQTEEIAAYPYRHYQYKYYGAEEPAKKKAKKPI